VHGLFELLRRRQPAISVSGSCGSPIRIASQAALMAALACSYSERWMKMRLVEPQLCPAVW